MAPLARTRLSFLRARTSSKRRWAATRATARMGIVAPLIGDSSAKHSTSAPPSRPKERADSELSLGRLFGVPGGVRLQIVSLRYRVGVAEDVLRQALAMLACPVYGRAALLLRQVAKAVDSHELENI